MKRIFKISLFSTLLIATPLLSLSCQSNLKIEKEVDAKKSNINNYVGKISEKIKNEEANAYKDNSLVSVNIEIDDEVNNIMKKEVNSDDIEIPIKLNNEQFIQKQEEIIAKEEKNSVEANLIVVEKISLKEEKDKKEEENYKEEIKNKIINKKTTKNYKIDGRKVAGVVFALLIEFGLVFGTAYGIYKYINPSIIREITTETITHWIRIGKVEEMKVSSILQKSK
ncbi:hypothetical protein QLQ80_02765 [Mycoplasma sp. M5725]|uniref:Lipoprotein n=1 Tax=Mycoplasma phocimorsus TaxID=3045839 RepID=A0AAJ1UZQ7_9MOLU|nr:hypothetical protein [Mycoplasma phocimorsus]MDJ1645988.1 hypothetical protein [Mycoplasma phocimorsus]